MTDQERAATKANMMAMGIPKLQEYINIGIEAMMAIVAQRNMTPAQLHEAHKQISSDEITAIDQELKNLP